MTEEKESQTYGGTKEALVYKISAGHAKKCLGCPLLIGSEHKKCGLCAGKEKALKNLKEIENIKLEIKLKK